MFQVQFKRKLINQTWEKSKILLSALILARLAKFRAANNFSKNLALLVTKYHVQLSSCTIAEKANDQILRKFSDGRTDWRLDKRDRQTDESDFIVRCLTDTEWSTIPKSLN